MPENNTLQPKNVVPLKPAQDNVITIDLVELFFELKKHILLLVMSLIIGGGVGYVVSKFVMVPTYTSTSIIYVMSKETTLTSLESWVRKE